MSEFDLNRLDELALDRACQGLEGSEAAEFERLLAVEDDYDFESFERGQKFTAKKFGNGHGDERNDYRSLAPIQRMLEISLAVLAALISLRRSAWEKTLASSRRICK